jgi:Na+-translocating ferredoxin:NAD+ oxidoreductase RnfC subunit
MRDGRRVPVKTLTRRLNVEEYDHPAPWTGLELKPARVVLPLKQGAGAPTQPTVKSGDQVASGQALGTLPPNALGAIIHSPFAGRVVSVTDRVVLERLS